MRSPRRGCQYQCSMLTFLQTFGQYAASGSQSTQRLKALDQFFASFAHLLVQPSCCQVGPFESEDCQFYRSAPKESSFDFAIWPTTFDASVAANLI